VEDAKSRGFGATGLAQRHRVKKEDAEMFTHDQSNKRASVGSR